MNSQSEFLGSIVGNKAGQAAELFDDPKAMTTLEAIFVVALLLKTSMELLLEGLNRSFVRKKSDALPKGLEGVMDKETYVKANSYTIEKSRFGSLELIFDATVLLIVILTHVLPGLFDWWKVWAGESNWSSAMFLVFVTVLFGIPGIPFEYWGQFKIEEKYGFNRSTIKLWIFDKIKGGVIGFVIGFPLLWLLISLVGWLGSYWWIYAFAIMISFQLVMIVLYPMVILPLFNKLSPLEDGSLKDRLMALSERAGFKAQTIQVIDGSKRSSHSNAYFTGFGRFRRIVLYDTLIDQMGEEELEAVLAHEIGHYKRGHIPKRMVFMSAMMLGGFWAIDYLAFKSPWFFEGFGFADSNLGIAFLLFSLVGGLFTYWLAPISNKMSRNHEYEADAFARDAVGSSKPLSDALRNLSEKNLSNLNPHPAYSAFHYSHPTLLEREKALDE